MIKGRRLLLNIVIIVLTFFILKFIQNTLFHSDGLYINIFFQSFREVALLNIVNYVKLFSSYFGSGLNFYLRYFLLFTFSGFALLGYIRKCRDDISIFDVFVPVYFVLILGYPAFSDGLRLFIPLIPLFFVYSLYGLQTAGKGRMKRIMPWLSAGLFLIVFGSFCVKFTLLDYGPVREGAETQEVRELFDFIRGHTDPEDTIIFDRPRILAYHTRRHSAIMTRSEDYKQTRGFFNEIGADYLIEGAPFKASVKYIRGFARKYEKDLTIAFVNAHYKVYKIKRKGQ